MGRMGSVLKMMTPKSRSNRSSILQHLPLSSSSSSSSPSSPSPSPSSSPCSSFSSLRLTSSTVIAPSPGASSSSSSMASLPFSSSPTASDARLPIKPSRRNVKDVYLFSRSTFDTSPSSLRYEQQQQQASIGQFHERVIAQLRVCMDVKGTVDLRKGPETPMVRFATLVYNAFAVEVRDMFRMFDALSRCRVEVAKFYEWFEGFFEMVKTVMQAFDDVVFMSSSSLSLSSSSSSSSSKGNNKKDHRREHEHQVRRRREHKQQCIRQQCFDILDMYQKQKSRVESDLFTDLAYELELLALNVMTYFHVQLDTMPAALTQAYSAYELNELETQLTEYLVRSDQGRFVLCAILRSFKEEEEEEEEDGDVVLSGINAEDATGGRLQQEQEDCREEHEQEQATDRRKGSRRKTKECEKMFRTLHVDFVDMFAVDKMSVRASYRSCKCIDDAFALMPT